MARAVASVLKEHEIPVRLADTNWENIRLARMDNLPVYFGNPASEHASNNIDLTGIGRLLVVSRTTSTRWFLFITRTGLAVQKSTA